MPLSRLEPGTSGKRWVSVANWATPVGNGYKSKFKDLWLGSFKNLNNLGS
ncbi:hypothetical protein Hanom_Chr14g01253841 [Helianthus anomalus]